MTRKIVLEGTEEQIQKAISLINLENEVNRPKIKECVIENLFSIEDVKHVFLCDDNEAQSLLEEVFSNEKTINEIRFTIDFLGQERGFKKKTTTWTMTDISCNQMMRQLSYSQFEFKEDRVVNPETKETEVYHSIIDLNDYTQEQMYESVESFGYSFNEMCHWIDEGINLELIAECIFEMES